MLGRGESTGHRVADGGVGGTRTEGVEVGRVGNKNEQLVTN